MKCRQEPSSSFIIYMLHHPESVYVYVGKSTKGLDRPRQHDEPANLRRYAHLPRSKWILSQQKHGRELEVVVLEECTRAEDLDEAERFHISYFRSLFGVRRLLNLTDGGDGISGYRHSDKARARLSAKSKERASTEEGRQLMSRMSSEYWADPEAREQQRIRKMGNNPSAEVRAKISAHHKGKPKSAEHRAKLSAAAKIRCADPAYLEKQRRVQIIAQQRPDVRARKSEAARRQWDPEARKKKAAEVSAYWAERRKREDDKK